MPSEDSFPQDVQELISYFGEATEGQRVRAIPGEGTNVPVWILGSSLGGAQLAANLGLPFAFASHFAPDQLDVALAAYRARFVPSSYLQKPQVMLSLSVVAADYDEEAKLLFTSALQATTAPLPPPIPDYESQADPQRLALVRNSLRHSLVGSPDTIAKGLAQFISRYQPDEIIATSQIFDHAAHMKSMEILSRVTSPVRA